MGIFGTREVIVERIVEREVILLGTPEPVTLYLTEDPFARNRYIYGRGGPPPEWHGLYFRTCEQAFAECPAANVNKVERWLLDGRYLATIRTEEITVQPKPKVDKG